MHVLPKLEPLLLVSHALLPEVRRLVLRWPRSELMSSVRNLTETVVQDPNADYEMYRRLAELLRLAGARESLSCLLGAASSSTDPDIQEVAEDFDEA